MAEEFNANWLRRKGSDSWVYLKRDYKCDLNPIVKEVKNGVAGNGSYYEIEGYAPVYYLQCHKDNISSVYHELFLGGERGKGSVFELALMSVTGETEKDYLGVGFIAEGVVTSCSVQDGYVSLVFKESAVGRKVGGFCLDKATKKLSFQSES